MPTTKKDVKVNLLGTMKVFLKNEVIFDSLHHVVQIILG